MSRQFLSSAGLSVASLAATLGAGVVYSNGTTLSAATRVVAGTDYISVGASPAAAGNARFPKDSNALTGANQAGGGTVYGVSFRTGENGLVLGADTALANPADYVHIPVVNQLRVYCGSQTSRYWAFHDDGTPGLSQVGATATPNAGALRFLTAQTIITSKANNGTDNLNVIATDSSDRVVIGGTYVAGVHTTILGTVIGAWASTGLTIASTGTITFSAATTSSSGSALLKTAKGVNLWSPRNNADSGNLFALSMSTGADRLNVGADNALTNRVDKVYIAPSTDARVYPNNQSSRYIGFFDDGSVSYMTFTGSTTIATVGSVRNMKNVTVAANRNNGDTGDIPIAATNSSDEIVFGGANATRLKATYGTKTQAVTPTRVALTWPSDANHTAAASTYEATLIDLSGGSLSATRDLVVPLTSGYVWDVINGTSGGQSVQVIGASGTGITIATGKAARVAANGTNIVRLTADV